MCPNDIFHGTKIDFLHAYIKIFVCVSAFSALYQWQADVWECIGQKQERKHRTACWQPHRRLLFYINTAETEIRMKPQDIIKEKSNLWIFGYGSLVWKPDFAFKRSKVGFIKGYKRRFWHGDDFYRGDKEKVRLYCIVLCIFLFIL